MTRSYLSSLKNICFECPPPLTNYLHTSALLKNLKKRTTYNSCVNNNHKNIPDIVAALNLVTTKILKKCNYPSEKKYKNDLQQAIIITYYIDDTHNTTCENE